MGFIAHVFGFDMWQQHSDWHFIKRETIDVSFIRHCLYWTHGKSTHKVWEQFKHNYHISRPIRRTMIFSLEILEKNNDECILILVIYWKNRIVTYQN